MSYKNHKGNGYALDLELLIILYYYSCLISYKKWVQSPSVYLRSTYPNFTVSHIVGRNFPNSLFCRYEAWVIYNFLSLCLAWVGGPGVVATSLHGRFLKPSWHLMTCCCDAIPLDGYVLSLFCYHTVMQDYTIKIANLKW